MCPSIRVWKRLTGEILSLLPSDRQPELMQLCQVSSPELGLVVVHNCRILRSVPSCGLRPGRARIFPKACFLTVVRRRGRE